MRGRTVDGAPHGAQAEAYGADWVKIYAGQDFMGDEYQHFKPDGTMVNSPSLTLEETQAIMDEAHRRGMRVACHSFGGEGLASCVTAGVDKVEHGNEMPDEVAKEMAQKKISLVFTMSNMLETPQAGSAAFAAGKSAG